MDLTQLFRGEKTFQGKTVLMLTHDIEPIVDIGKVMHGDFQPIPYNSFLSLGNGKITEIEITHNDLQSFAQICMENIKDANLPDIIKAIYLRRHYEILNSKGLEYQMLASLFHLRPTPTNEMGIKREFTVEEKGQAQKNIKADLANFDYDTLLKELRDKDSMRKKYKQTSNRYEKLQLFRLIKEQNEPDTKRVLHESPVIKKQINESFHIENELIIQLNPKKYDFVPEYVINECNLALGITG